MKALLFHLLTAIILAVPLPAQTFITKTLDVGSGGETGRDTSHAIVNGNPAVAYYNITDSNLMFARNSAADGSGTWAIITVDSVGNTGEYPSLAVVNGNPAISYRYSGSGGSDDRLMYVRALDANGMNWGAPVAIGSLGPLNTSLSVVNGNPAISYAAGDLNYVRALDASGTNWGTPVTLDSTGDVGRYCSMAVIAGNPAVSYYDLTNGDLKFVRATDASGATWAASLILDSVGDVGRSTSLKVVNGNPAIAYGDDTNKKIKFVSASNASGSSWGTPGSLKSPGGAECDSPSLAMVDGRPAISYFDSTNGNLVYVRALNPDGTSWGNDLLSVDISGNVGGFSSLAVVGGNPAVSYHDYTNDDLKYVRANDTSGTSWALATTADAGFESGIVGSYNSQLIVNGNPAISYHDSSNGDLKYVRALDSNGTNWDTPVTLDSTGNVGQYTSLEVVNGNPAISYYDVTNGNLRYVRALNASGTSWGTPVTLDSTGNVGLYTSLEVVDGNPAVSYYDDTNDNLKFVRATDASGAIWDSPIIVASLLDVGKHTSLAVVDGKPAVSYLDAFHVRLKFVRATDASGSIWGTPVTLDSTGGEAQYISFAVVNGMPALSYYTANSKALKFVRAVDAGGTSWGSPVTVDTVGPTDFISSTSIAVVNGNPAISYAITTDAVKYLRADDSNGTSWGASLNLDGSGFFCSLAVVGGNPAISYDGGDLKWATLLPDIAVIQAFTLTDGAGGVSFGPVPVGGSAVRPFTITNTGSAELTGLVVSKNGADEEEFTVSTLSGTSIPVGPGTVTFSVTFTPSGAVSGTRTAAIQIASDDPDENPFDIALTGTILSTATDGDGDGLNDWAEFKYSSLGFDWQVGQTTRVNALFSNLGNALPNVNAAGFYSTAQVQALHIDAPLIQRNPGTGVFTLTLGLQKSTNLSLPNSFLPFPFIEAGTVINGQGKIEFQFTVPDNAAFFRLEAP